TTPAVCTALSNCATLGVRGEDRDRACSCYRAPPSPRGRCDGTFALHGGTFQSASSDCDPQPLGPCTTIPRLPVPSVADSSIGSSLFTRRYSGNHGCFLVLR